MNKLSPSQIIDNAIAKAAQTEADAAQAVTLGGLALYEYLKEAHGIPSTAVGLAKTVNFFNEVMNDLTREAATMAAADAGLTLADNVSIILRPEARKALVSKALDISIEAIKHRERVKAQGR